MHTVLRFQQDRRIGSKASLVQIIFERREHGSVAHVVTKDDEVVAAECTAVIQERNAGVAVLLIEVHAQILLRPFRGVHHGIVHGGVVDGDPSDAVAVLIDQKRNVVARRQNRVFLFLLRIRIHIRILRIAVSLRLRCFFRLIRLLDLCKL